MIITDPEAILRLEDAENEYYNFMVEKPTSKQLHTINIICKRDGVSIPNIRTKTDASKFIAKCDKDKFDGYRIKRVLREFGESLAKELGIL